MVTTCLQTQIETNKQLKLFWIDGEVALNPILITKLEINSNS